MADKLVIMMVNTDPGSPVELGVPLFQATVAASMGYAVEVVLSGRAAYLAREGAAADILVHEDTAKTVYDFIKDAHEAGVRFKVCSATVELPGQEDFIPEVEETVASAYLISTAMSDGVVTFTY